MHPEINIFLKNHIIINKNGNFKKNLKKLKFSSKIMKIGMMIVGIKKILLAIAKATKVQIKYKLNLSPLL
jgi:hypothetical protein